MDRCYCLGALKPDLMTVPNTITAHWEQSQLATDQVLQTVHTGHRIFLVLHIM